MPRSKQKSEAARFEESSNPLIPQLPAVACALKTSLNVKPVFSLRVVAALTLAACGTQGSPVDTIAPHSRCPDAPPTVGDRCPADGATCEYGSEPSTGCNLVIQCLQGSWHAGRGACPYAVDEPRQCPASWSAIIEGSACTAPVRPCTFAEGSCFCGSDSGWHCLAAQTGCPFPRPRLGDDCTGTLTCNYGACIGGNIEVCKDGSWQSEGVICP